MKADAVIGCEAVDAGTEWLRLTTATGATRTIPWSAIRLAGMGAKLEGHVTIQGVTENVAPFVATHDSLWIAYGEDDFAQVMIEKTVLEQPGARRVMILAAFAQHLGERWQGDELTGSDLMGAMMIPHKIRIPKAIVAMLAAMAIIFFLAMAVVFLTHGAKPTAP